MRLGITTFDPRSRASIGGLEGITSPLMRWTPVGWPPRLDPAQATPSGKYDKICNTPG